MFKKKIKNYISNIDIFLQEFDKKHPKSESQLAEIQKYQRVFALRDNPIADNIHEDEFFS
jgi:nitrate/nitrite-specific signal transduction histidine kinase